MQHSNLLVVVFFKPVSVNGLINITMAEQILWMSRLKFAANIFPIQFVDS